MMKKCPFCNVTYRATQNYVACRRCGSLLRTLEITPEDVIRKILKKAKPYFFKYGGDPLQKQEENHA